MLAALEQGVKGGKWYCLMDKVMKPDNLRASFTRVERNGGAAGIDHVTPAMFGQRREENLAKLIAQLGDGTYEPRQVRRKYIPKPGSAEKRPLGIPTVRDRTVQGAVRQVLEPIFERGFAEHSYGFRPGRGCRDALRCVQGLLDGGDAWVVDADIKGYFDSIPHERLMARLREKVTDGSVLALVEKFLKQEIFDGLKQWTPEAGTPQGAVLSPLLANIYLDPLDHLMEREGFAMVRYADDFVVLCWLESDARRAMDLIRAWTEAEGLRLHPDKTRIVDAMQKGGFDFLGYHFERGYRWPRKKSAQKLRDTIRRHTHRANGQSLSAIIACVNLVLRGWFGYFKHSHRTALHQQDRWVRQRLRAILRKRLKLKGRPCGQDFHRWPNAFFADHGLFSLAAAHDLAVQSARR
jgi:RNA-directed DNA polymerase